MKPLSPWAQEANDHLQKYRPKLHRQLTQSGQLENYLNGAVERAKDEFVNNVQSGMSALEAQSEAKRNHLFLPSEEDQPNLGENPTASPDPASLITTPGVIQRKKSA